MRRKEKSEEQTVKQKTVTKQKQRKRGKRKRVRLIDGEKLIACKKYSSSVPYSRVATDFAEQYSNKAYDFKLVAKDDWQNWFFIIVADKKYEIAQEELVVPTDYALLWVAAQEQENALVLVPHQDSLVIGAVKDGEVIYVQETRVSIYSEMLDGLSVAVDTALTELRESKIVVNTAYIVNPPEEVPLRVINLFKAFDLPSQVINVDPALYQGDLTFNVNYAYRKKFSFSTFFATMEQNRRKIILEILSVLTAFMWAYLPAHATLNLVKDITVATSVEIQHDINRIQSSKQAFSATLENISRKLNTLESYKTLYNQLPAVDYISLSKIILSDPHVTTFSISGNQANITFASATSKELDVYVDKLLSSNYFNSVQLYPRIANPQGYTIIAEVKMP